MKTEKPDPPEPPPRNPLRVMASISSEVNFSTFFRFRDFLQAPKLPSTQKNAITPEASPAAVEPDTDAKSPEAKDPKEPPKGDEKCDDSSPKAEEKFSGMCQEVFALR